MEKIIEADNYLHNLQLDIMHDDSIKSREFDVENSRINEEILKQQVYFFDELGLKLHRIYTLLDDVEMELSPQYIAIDLSKDNRSITMSIFDRDNGDVLYPDIDIRNINNYTPRINYIHELVHTQVDNRFNMNNILNNELLPIFMELLYSDRIKYDNRVNDRLVELSTAIGYLYDPEHKEENSRYIYSVLQALNLYRLYNRSNEEYKKEIIRYIQLLFNRDIYLEELLDKYNINYDNSKVNLRELKQSK